MTIQPYNTITENSHKSLQHGYSLEFQRFFVAGPNCKSWKRKKCFSISLWRQICILPQICALTKISDPDKSFFSVSLSGARGSTDILSKIFFFYRLDVLNSAWLEIKRKRYIEGQDRIKWYMMKVASIDFWGICKTVLSSWLYPSIKRKLVFPYSM